jgi:tetratricopeptide (TPR) repeat protein
VTRRAMRNLVLAATLIAAAGCSRSPEARESSFLKSAQKHLQARDIPRAILDFKNAAVVMPRDPEPHYRMGLAYSSAGNLQDSLKEFDKTAEIDPRHASALLKAAEILIAAKNLSSGGMPAGIEALTGGIQLASVKSGMEIDS